MDENLSEDLKAQLLEKELNRMLSVSEAAELLGVSATSIRRFSRAGKLKTYRISTGGHRRFRKKDVLDFLETDSTIEPEAVNDK